MGYVDVRRRRHEAELVQEEPGLGELWLTVKDNPYLSLAAGPLAGCLTMLFFIYTWDTISYAGMIFQYAVALAVMLAFALRAAGLFGRQEHRSAGTRTPKTRTGAEKQLLLALRESGGLTAVEAALETSLTVDEADEILCRLAERGHLRVEGRDGVLCYSLPGRRHPT